MGYGGSCEESWGAKRDHFEPSTRKVLHMTNDETTRPAGYSLGPDARVVLHRNGARSTYAVAVVLDEGPYSLLGARLAASRLREIHGGWVSKADAADRLGVSERQVDYLREQGRLESTSDETHHVLIAVDSLNAEIRRREDGVL